MCADTTRPRTTAGTSDGHFAPTAHWLTPALAGLTATLLGLGIARFAYTPMLPALVGQGWLSGDGAAYIGAVNLLGYLAGALCAAPLSRLWPAARVLRAAMLLTVVSLAACAWNGGFAWLAGWRLLAGATGAVIIVLAGPTVLAAVPMAAKPRAIGVVFSGIGLGVVFAGFGVPALVPFGMEAAWLALAALALALTVFSWSRWPRGAAAPPRQAADAVRAMPLPLVLFTLAYAGDGFGYVPHTLFLSDFIARGLNLGVAVGGIVWAAFGAGAALGAVFGGWLAARMGFGPAFALALALKTLAVGLPLLATDLPVLILSAFIVGLLTPGSVTLASGVAASMAGSAGHVRAWGWMTAAFALAQAIGGYALSALFAVTGVYWPLFAAGTATLFLGTACGLLGVRLSRRSVQ